MSTFCKHRVRSASGLFMVALFTLATLAARAQQPEGLPISAQQFTVRNAGTLDGVTLPRRK